MNRGRPRFSYVNLSLTGPFEVDHRPRARPTSFIGDLIGFLVINDEAKNGTSWNQRAGSRGRLKNAEKRMKMKRMCTGETLSTIKADG